MIQLAMTASALKLFLFGCVHFERDYSDFSDKRTISLSSWSNAAVEYLKIFFACLIGASFVINYASLCKLVSGFVCASKRFAQTTTKIYSQQIVNHF